MKKLLFASYLLLVSFYSAFSQHCPWDNTTILVVEIKAEGGDQTINGLQVNLLDPSLHDVIISLWDSAGRYKTVAQLWRNPEADIPPYKALDKPIEFRFWFARDNYILFCEESIPQDNLVLRVTDPDGEMNQGTFRTTYVDIRKKDFYPLCTNYGEWDTGEEKGFHKDFKPVRVVLAED